MARPLRIEYEGAVYHIMGKGNRGELIFSEDRDKEQFIGLLERAVDRYGVAVYGWCIMGNHYHLLISTPEKMLSKAMHFIASGYGSYLRRSRGWIGHIFAGRYKSLCVEKESYLLELSRYIHLNPVRAALVTKPEAYRWSSYRQYIGNQEGAKWLQTEWLLSEFGATYRTSRNRYRKFIEAGIAMPERYPLERVVGQAVMGSEGFVQKVINKVSKEPKLVDVTAQRMFSGKPATEDLYRAVCEHYGLDNLIGRKREQEIFIRLAKGSGNALNREIADKIGVESPSAVTHRYSRIVRRMKTDRNLRKQWEKEKRIILSRFKG